MPAIVAVHSECVTGTVLSNKISLLGGESVPGDDPAEEKDECEIQ